jgi:very-short-patch-repair endonuclease
MIKRQIPPELWAKIKQLARQMRCAPTPAENRLWQQLRNRQLCGVKFRRQHHIERFIVDFMALTPYVAIEVDGPIHDYTPEQDASRQEFIEAHGIRVIRFKNEEVFDDLPHVLATIKDFVTH